MKKKRVLKIILINLLIFVGLIVCFEYVLYLEISKKACIEGPGRGFKNYIPPKYSFKMRKFEELYTITKHFQKGNYGNLNMRSPEGLNYTKKPIILFGCSFTFGYSLKDEQTFSYKLSHLSKRPVYNRASGGWGVQHMLYQSRRKDFYSEVKEPEYIIYVLINRQLHRLVKKVWWQPSNDLYLHYKENNGDLVEDNSPWSFLWFSCIIKNYFENVEERNFVSKDFNKSFDFMKLHFLKSKQEFQKHYPHTKFVILKYREMMGSDCSSELLDTERWEELKKAGFIVIDTKDLVGSTLCSYNYVLSKEDTHPNEKAWDLVTPALIKRLNL